MSDITATSLKNKKTSCHFTALYYHIEHIFAHNLCHISQQAVQRYLCLLSYKPSHHQTTIYYNIKQDITQTTGYWNSLKKYLVLFTSIIAAVQSSSNIVYYMSYHILQHIDIQETNTWYFFATHHHM
jgi:hypothetical protein